jgi:acyl-CoA synthetase (AMP-forming)/AMP-acid ligase II
VDEINKGGLKIQPQDVENVAAAYPAVSDVCVFAVSDELYGQNVAIAFAMDDDRPETLAGLYGWMRERLSRHKMPARWYRLDAIPRTARGKIHRASVAARCAELAPVDPAGVRK